MLDFLFDKEASLIISLPYWQEVNVRRINAKTTENQANRMELKKKRLFSIELEKMITGDPILF